jgi:hypothetical protein
MPSLAPNPIFCRFSHDNKAPVRPNDTPANFSTDGFGLLCGFLLTFREREIRHQSASLHLAVSMGLIACVNIAKHYTM